MWSRTEDIVPVMGAHLAWEIYEWTGGPNEPLPWYLACWTAYREKPSADARVLELAERETHARDVYENSLGFARGYSLNPGNGAYWFNESYNLGGTYYIVIPRAHVPISHNEHGEICP